MKTKIVCLCGSTRFREAFEEIMFQESLMGNIVLTVGFFMHRDDKRTITDKQKQMLDELHKRKIDLADEVIFLNVCGYIGSSTKGELEYSRSKNKAIRFLCNELCAYRRYSETYSKCWFCNDNCVVNKRLKRKK